MGMELKSKVNPKAGVYAVTKINKTTLWVKETLFGYDYKGIRPNIMEPV
jgi:hypothetical protein